jgi:hypothetical protein
MTMNFGRWWGLGFCVSVGGCLSDARPPTDAAPAGGIGSGAVTFSIDATRGPARQFQPPDKPVRVPDTIYGINAGLMGTAISVDLVSRVTRWGLVRQGGDAYTSWNWTNNYNNSGSDYCFVQGAGIGDTTLAGAITAMGDTIPAAQAKGEAFLATVPILDYVAAADDNTVDVCPVAGAFCDGTARSTGLNSNQFPFATDADAGDAGGTAFVPNVAAKPGGTFCTCASACSGGCQVAGTPVYQDEFVHYLKQTMEWAPLSFSVSTTNPITGGARTRSCGLRGERFRARRSLCRTTTS